MVFDFDQWIDRSQTHSVKFDGRGEYFGREDVNPLWVADMDFAVAPCVTQALTERIRHPLFGYTEIPSSLYEAMIRWFATRHGWHIQKEWIVVAPGVLSSMVHALSACVPPGEGVIVQPPVYFPFFSLVKEGGGRLILNPLLNVDGRYQMDFDHLDYCAKQGARALILCSPHNPVGRVWRAEELDEILRLSRKHGLVVFSDEAHCDLAYAGEQHVMLGARASSHDKVVTFVSPSKAFNIHGLGLSALIIPDPALRGMIQKALLAQHVNFANPLSIVAFEAAYRDGSIWLDQLLSYLGATREGIARCVQASIPGMTAVMPEATYLFWLDCRGMGMGDAELREFFVRRCGVGMNSGSVFGEQGSGYMRMNFAAPRARVMAALESIRMAIDGA